jgi:recombination protein RecA
MSQALRKLTAAISKAKTVVIFINQIRMKIGVIFGNPETTPGGRALKFYSSVRLDVRRVSTIKDGDTAVGNHVKVKVVKNKVAAPFREGEFDIMFDGGISVEGDLLDLALQSRVIHKSGAWFSYKDVRLGQGRENVKAFLKDNPDLKEEIRTAILAQRPEVEPQESGGDTPSGTQPAAPAAACERASKTDASPARAAARRTVATSPGGGPRKR